ncbi:hypothetical protein [Wolbachia endosymbiont (group B) of Rhopobota naevana]|uniref:hypothetical protein n=1 Tax=Wolbachia endosymbiont (group B) of Rhopobota naevana TaxID=2954054 RepID=UPI002226DA71|nr:hypothetical protein [Wolbachia endosymbiont (group B) of Rhopobota naevana]
MHNNGENIGLIRSLLNGNSRGFVERFESFLDQCPSFLHSVGKDRFFPAFFFGMFATAFDSDVADDGRIFFRFENYGEQNRKGNLKVAVLTNDMARRRKIVRCYTISDRINSPHSRFSTEEREWVENTLYPERVFCEEYKVSAWADNQGEDEEEAIRCVQFNEREAFAHTRPFNDGFREIVRTRQQDYLSDLIEGLASNDAGSIRDDTRRILQYIIGIYNRYDHVLDFNGKESDYHGFLSGFLMNFRYRHIAGIHLELFVGGGYTDITFLVRGVQRLRDSVPIIIELKAGQARDRQVDRALVQAENYVRRCPVSSISIHTSSENAVCVGLNFELGRFRTSIEDFLEKELSLVERLFEPVAEEGIEENVRDYLLYPAFGVPAVPGIRNRDGVSARDRRIFLYTTGFTFGNATFAKRRIELEDGSEVYVNKYLLRYHDDDKMLDLQGGVTQVNVGNRAFTMILHALLGREERVIILNVRHVLATHQFPERGLDLSRWPNARVREVLCELDPVRRAEDDLGLTVAIETFDSPADYLRDRGNQHFQGELSQISGVSNVHSAAGIMMNTGWQVQNRHAQMFQAISNVLFPLRWIVNRDNAREAGFHSILHGLFYACDNPARVIIEFQLGGGERLDLVLLRSPDSRDGVHPIGIELKFAGTGELQSKKREANNQLDDYMHCRGYKRITDGDTVVLSYAIWNDRAQGPNTLISVKDVLRIKDNLGHSSADDLPGR